VTGAGAVTNNGSTTTFTGDWSGFSGTVTTGGLLNISKAPVSGVTAATSANAAYLIGKNDPASLTFASNGNYTARLGSLATTTGAGSSTTIRGSNSGGTFGTITLEVGNLGANTDYAGIIANNAGGGSNIVAFTKVGSGTQTFSGASNNTYTGKTTITSGTLILNKTAGLNAISSTGAAGGSAAATDVQITGGTLQLNASNQIVNTAKMGLSGGTFNLNSKQEGATSGGVATAGIGALTLSANSSIDFGSGSTTAVAAFADSSGQTWSGSTTLSILNWNGIAGSTSSNGGGGTEALFFGSTLGGLTSTQLGEISFVNPNGMTGTFSAGMNSNGEVFAIEAVPEPTTIFGALALVGLVGWRERKRFGMLRRRFC
jgi:fibronectin-binding autotransporter adhesin